MAALCKGAAILLLHNLVKANWQHIIRCQSPETSQWLSCSALVSRLRRGGSNSPELRSSVCKKTPIFHRD